MKQNVANGRNFEDCFILIQNKLQFFELLISKLVHKSHNFINQTTLVVLYMFDLLK